MLELGAKNDGHGRYGTVETSENGHDLMHLRRNKRHGGVSYLSMTGKFFAVAAVGTLALGFCVSLQTRLSHQHDTILSMQHQLDAMHAAVVSQSAMKASADFSSSTKLPFKFAVDSMTPLKTQDFRGTCWDFGAVGVLEQTYRQQGFEHGWLAEDEYVALSEQAFGEETIRLCAGPPDSEQQRTCFLPGNSIWHNSTEGGEASVLYYLQNGMHNSIFPVSICPYTSREGKDNECPGLEDARSSNPLMFSLDHMETFYEELSVKNALVKENKAMAFTTSMPYITHYYPCIGDYVNDPRCNPASPSCTLCPPELSMSVCCVPITGGENYNMHGEFIAHRGMTIEGGHVMVLAGYNDLYRTRDGFTGGYILKNSWHDGIHPELGPEHPRGSHSLKYWMQEVTDWEERTMCPNSQSPHSWYQCGNMDSVVHGNGGKMHLPLPFKRANAFREGVESCLAEETKLFAKTNIQPLHLRCTSEDYCIQNDEMVYFVRNTTEWGDRMQVMCLFEYNQQTTESNEICLPPMLMESIAYIFTPVDEERFENDPDVCGYYFFPYEVQRQYVNHFEGFYVNSFDIKWHKQSYAANREDYPDLDYFHVQKSTYKQNKYSFDGPLPFAQVVDFKDKNQ